MNVKKLPTWAAAACCIAVTAVLLLVTLVLRSSDDQKHSPSHTVHAAINAAHYLLLDSREELIVCLGNYSGHENSHAQWIATVNTHIEQLRSHPQWHNRGPGDLTIKVKDGCSFTPALLEEQAVHPIYGKGGHLGRRVETPSVEAGALFIVDRAVIDKHFAAAPTRWSPEQMYCPQKTCFEVSSALYFTADEMTRDDFVYRQLAYLLKLESVSKAQPISTEQLEKEIEAKQSLRPSQPTQ